MMQNKVTPEMLNALKEEVATLETNNTNEIQVFEKSLQELQGLPSIEDIDWSPELDIEIITMEKIPPLSSSIREIVV